MRKAVSRLAILSVMGLPVVAMAVPAGASTGSPTIRVVQPGAHSEIPAVTTTPKVKIVGAGSTAVYKPTAITVAEDTVNSCTTGFVSFKLVNKGTATAYVLVDGAPQVAIPAGSKVAECVFGGVAGDHLTFGLTNKKVTKTYAATLVVTTSD